MLEWRDSTSKQRSSIDGAAGDAPGLGIGDAEEDEEERDGCEKESAAGMSGQISVDWREWDMPRWMGDIDVGSCMRVTSSEHAAAALDQTTEERVTTEPSEFTELGGRECEGA